MKFAILNIALTILVLSAIATWTRNDLSHLSGGLIICFVLFIIACITK